MALSREDFIRAKRGEKIAIPPQAFVPPKTRDESWPDFPDLRKAVEWFKSFLTPTDWEVRRNAAFIRYHSASFGLEPDELGRYFDAKDTFAWYLFLAESYLDHVWNYDPTFGSRVIPLFATIGRNIDLLKSVKGLDERAKRLAGSERRQPNGGIFELLVAVAYRRQGAEVAFLPETPGRGKTHDMDVQVAGSVLAVECKRLETSEYSERERARMRQLWRRVPGLLFARFKSAFANIQFQETVFEVPNSYLEVKALDWLSSGRSSFRWDDGISSGVIANMDLRPLQKVLKDYEVRLDSSRLQELLSGTYARHAGHNFALRCKYGASPRYVAECDWAALLRWQSLAPKAIAAKARDIIPRLADANKQLPLDRSGIVHVGFEAVDGDEVERARHRKIFQNVANFDPKGKPLRYVYCHYFVPESPPDESWAFDETVQWQRISGSVQRPLLSAFLVLPNEAASRMGPHWDQY